MTIPGMPILDQLRGRLIVSCQAYPGEPMNHAETMAQMAESVAAGGAGGIRAQGIAEIRAIRARVDLPLIGLWKSGRSGVFITPTVDHAMAVADAGADIVAIDGTIRPRPDGRHLAETIDEIHTRAAVLVMADCSSVADGVAAEAAGADVIGTTLAGYVTAGPVPEGPDLHLVEDLATRVTVPVFAEGRIHHPEQVRQALAHGASAVVVGTAITHPTTITRWFADAAEQHDA